MFVFLIRSLRRFSFCLRTEFLARDTPIGEIGFYENGLFRASAIVKGVCPMCRVGAC